MRNAGIFLSHVRSERINRHFERLVSDTNSLIDWTFVFNPGNGSTPVSDLDIIPAETSMTERYHEFMRNGGVQNGLMDVVIFPSVIATGAEYVWAMEYDVDFSGHWARFFEQFEENTADLLSSTIQPYQQSKNWWHWQTAAPPLEVPRRAWHRAFHPVMRLSRRYALWYQQKMAHSRWRGLYEYTVPTSAFWGGFRVEDLGGRGPFCPPDRHDQNYANNPWSRTLSPGTLTWRPFREQYFHESPEAFPEPNTVYHPVKADVSDWFSPSKSEPPRAPQRRCKALDVTTLSVVFNNSQLLKRNADLCQRLNPKREFPWIAVDNLGPHNAELSQWARFKQCRGTPDIPASVSLDRGSLHHSQGLAEGLKSGISSRFLLLMDPDFFVVRQNWMEDVLQHMIEQELTIFGSCWHPRWWYQHQRFPTVHFMMVDLQRFPLDQLDFTPGIREDIFYRAVSQATWLPSTLKRLLLMGRFKDTGYRVRERILKQNIHRYETLIPHVTPTWSPSLLGRLLERFPWLVPQMFSRNPRRGTYEPQSFLQHTAPVGYARGWEEFYWQGQPFAFHLRNIGRDYAATAREPELLRLIDWAPFS